MSVEVRGEAAEAGLESAPLRRVVLLGASNVALSFPVMMGLLRAGFGERLDVYAAFGHGRSYGTWSYIPVRGLPSILHCRLWEHLEQAEPATAGTNVLVTDVGNDVMYRKSPSRTLEWVAECLERLRGEGTEFVVTRPPLERVRRLQAWHYYTVARVFFPWGHPTWEEVQEAGAKLDAGLVELGERYGARLVAPPAEWYGFDPIHVRSSQRRAAWRAIFSGWPSFEVDEDAVPANVLDGLWWAWLWPEERRLLGWLQRTRQPVVERAGLRVSVY